MKRREAKSPASVEQLALPFDRFPKATRNNGAEPLAVRIPDAVRMTGIGRSKLYELIASGDLETIKIGSCTLVTIDALKALLANARPPTIKEIAEHRNTVRSGLSPHRGPSRSAKRYFDGIEFANQDSKPL